MPCDDNYVGDLWEDQAVPIAEADLIAVVVSRLTKGQGEGKKKNLTSSIIASSFHADKNNKIDSAVPASDLEKNNTLSICQEKYPQN